MKELSAESKLKIASALSENSTLTAHSDVTRRDDAAMTVRFLSLHNKDNGLVEEDSTDIYLLTRCSPLNDF